RSDTNISQENADNSEENGENSKGIATNLEEIGKNPEEIAELFWAHPGSVDLCKCFPKVFIMDATYKTNKYRWPFLQIVGVTSTYKTFTACQVLMCSEKQADYTWALKRFQLLLGNLTPSVIVTDRDYALMNATQVVFPNADKHLCRFHIATNVLRKGMDLLPTDKDIENLKLFWNCAVKSPTPEIFDKRFSRIEKMFRKEYYGLVCYLRNTWLIHKEMFVAAWTNRHLHFGCTTTNRVEGAHFQLKKDLGHTCQHDLLGMWSLIHPATNIQLREIRSSFERSLVHTA
ncbi:Far1-related sequence, partial [Thalictrum thalictroides]